MMCRLGFIVCHGWGLSAASLQPFVEQLAIAFPDAPIINIDMGYFDDITETAIIQTHIARKPINWIGIGHSQGFMQLVDWQHQGYVEWKALISLHGFTWFCRPSSPTGQTRVAGTPARVLKTMMNHLLDDPYETWLAFLTRSAKTNNQGVDHFLIHDTTGDRAHQRLIDHYAPYWACHQNTAQLAKRLHKGLENLARLPAFPQWPDLLNCPVCVIASEHDEIVPKTLTLQCFKNYSIQWVPSPWTHSHLGPCLSPDIYIATILAFIQNLPIKTAFSAAANTYDQYADIQAQTAQTLVEQIYSRYGGLSLAQTGDVIDIGCGTGFVTQALLEPGSHQHGQHPMDYPTLHTPFSWQISALDMAPGMLHAMEQRLQAHPWLQGKNPYYSINYIEADAQCFQPRQCVDIALSNLCFQWFDDWKAGIEHWLKYTRLLAINLLTDRSFKTWRQAHIQAGVDCGLRVLPSHQDITQYLDTLDHRGYEIYTHHETFWQHDDSGLNFARSLKYIGAATPRPGHRPLGLHRVLKYLPKPLASNYDMFFIYIRHQQP